MNTISATVINMKSVDGVTSLTLKSKSDILEVISLDIRSDIELGSRMVLGVEASHIALAKKISQEMSIVNRLQCSVVKIIKGELMWRVILEYHSSIFESIVSVNAAQKMNIEIGDVLFALVASSEFLVLEVE